MIHVPRTPFKIISPSSQDQLFLQLVVLILLSFHFGVVVLLFYMYKILLVVDDDDNDAADADAADDVVVQHVHCAISKQYVSSTILDFIPPFLHLCSRSFSQLTSRSMHIIFAVFFVVFQSVIPHLNTCLFYLTFLVTCRIKSSFCL